MNQMHLPPQPLDGDELPVGGPIIGYRVDPITKQYTPIAHCPHNLVLYSGSDIIARLLAGRTEYVIGAMYLEFTNSTFAIPSLARASTNGHAYYDALSGVTTTDFLRIAISISPALSAYSGDYAANIATFIAETSGSAGVKGQAFGTGSILVGGALVATPTDAFAGDIVYARFYFELANRMTKAAGVQLAVKWPTRIP